MNRLSGRLPVASTRRLSASISTSQRPHSSYSLNVNSGSSHQTEEGSMLSPIHQHQTYESSQAIVNSTNNCYFDHTITPGSSPLPLLSNTASSLLIRKQDNFTSPDNVVFRNQLPLPPPSPILNYTDHLKSMLQQQQQRLPSLKTLNNEEKLISTQNSFNNSTWSSNIMAPISVTTQLSEKALSSPNEESLQNKILSTESNFGLFRDRSNFNRMKNRFKFLKTKLILLKQIQKKSHNYRNGLLTRTATHLNHPIMSIRNIKNSL